MDKNKFSTLLECFQTSFKEVSEIMSELEMLPSDKLEITDENRYSVIIGAVGKFKGKMVLYAGENVVKKITEGMNSGPLNNTMDTYFYLAEFTNTFSGNGLTKINNLFKDSDLRLTPPSILAGSNMQITTPKIQTERLYFQCVGGGEIILDIGFEGE